MSTEDTGCDATIALATPPRNDVVAAILVDETGRYLLQLRDDFVGLPMAGHWGCFGGAIEPGETPEQAMRRELVEELAWNAREMYPLAVAAFAVWPGTPVLRKHFFVVPFRAEEAAAMVLGEGAALGFYAIAEACALERVVPWDLLGLMAHARHRQYWPDRAEPDWLK